ncbi:unnamed protein product [Brachionus calyciflorus]|uniref:G-protein coupled receptors family 1 profile domain-containing protein n=1 Tax=Brachionus calyciflorus TaxID=104777 RepID=A0A814G0D8_9BILA|nr:unnamed protein product [Brachionus calyciflorus]
MNGLCDFIGALCLIACVTSLINIGILALNRYFIICNNKWYKKIFSFKKTILYCLINWIIGILVDLPNLTGWGGHYYDSKTTSCIWNRLKSHSYSIFFPTSSILFPSVFILICYVRIFVFAKNSRKKVMNLSKENKKKGFNKSVKLAKGLFCSFMLFTACWLPYGLIVMTDFHDRLSRAAHMFPIAIAHFNSTLNPIFFGISNRHFKNGYKKFISLVLVKLRIGKKKDMKSSLNNSNGTKIEG